MQKILVCDENLQYSDVEQFRFASIEDFEPNSELIVTQFFIFQAAASFPSLPNNPTSIYWFFRIKMLETRNLRLCDTFAAYNKALICSSRIFKVSLNF